MRVFSCETLVVSASLTFDAPSFKMALHPDVDAYEQRDLETWAQCDTRKTLYVKSQKPERRKAGEHE
jgi:hypothetical protein